MNLELSKNTKICHICASQIFLDSFVTVETAEKLALSGFGLIPPLIEPTVNGFEIGLKRDQFCRDLKKTLNSSNNLLALLFGCTKSSIQAGKRTWRWFFGCGSWQYPLLWFIPRNDVLTKFLEEQQLLLPHLSCQLWKTTGFWKSRVRSGGNQKSQSASENFWWIEIVLGKIILMLGKNDHERGDFASGSAERHLGVVLLLLKDIGIWRMDHLGYFIRRHLGGQEMQPRLIPRGCPL